jgi:hypothetical protein
MGLCRKETNEVVQGAIEDALGKHEMQTTLIGSRLDLPFWGTVFQRRKRVYSGQRSEGQRAHFKYRQLHQEHPAKVIAAKALRCRK